MQRSGMTFLAVPPSTSVALAVGRPRSGSAFVEREAVEGDEVAGGARDGVVAEVGAGGVGRRAVGRGGEDQEALLGEARPQLSRLPDERGGHVGQRVAEHRVAHRLHAVVAAAGLLARRQRDDETAPRRRTPPAHGERCEGREHGGPTRLRVDGAAPVDLAVDARGLEGRVRVLGARRDHVEVRAEQEQIVALAQRGPHVVVVPADLQPADAARPRLDVVGDGGLLVAEGREADEVGVEVEDGHRHAVARGRVILSERSEPKDLYRARRSVCALGASRRSRRPRALGCAVPSGSTSGSALRSG